MLEEKRIVELIIADQNGNITKEERKLLDEWHSASEENKAYYSNVTELYKRTNEVLVYKKIDKKKAWGKIYKQLPQKSKTVKLWAFRVSAAVFLAVVGLAISTLLLNQETDLNHSIVPGNKIAYLELDNGKIIQVDTIANENEMKISGGLLKKDSSQIVYSANTFSANKETYNTLVVPRGGEYKIVLSDGTQVWANADTRFKYPVSFLNNERKVWLESGEVFLDVEHNKDKPFIVNSNGLNIEVLGTRFNVKAYTDELNMETTLAEGSIKLSSENESDKHINVELVPGQQLRYNPENKSSEINTVDVNQHIAWVWGEYQFENESLDNIMTTLSRWYNYEVLFENKELQEVNFSGKVKKYENIERFLSALEVFNEVKFEIDGTKIIIHEYK